MSESNKRTWDSERVAMILLEEINVEDNLPKDPRQAIEKLTDLLGSVRAEAIGWTWTEACSQHDRGMDPRNYDMALLLPRAQEDLNPNRE